MRRTSYAPWMKRVPILCLRPRLEVVKGNVGELTAERCTIDRVANTVEPLVHLGGVLTHALADDVQRDLEIGERPAGEALSRLGLRTSFEWRRHREEGG